MSEVLRLARQMAAKDLSWTEAVIRDEKRVLAAKATLDAIDAAIAAEAPAEDEPAGDDVAEVTITLNGASIAVITRISQLAEVLNGFRFSEGVAECICAIDCATGGTTDGEAPFGVVGKRAGEAIASCKAAEEAAVSGQGAYRPAHDLPHRGEYYLGDTVWVVTEWPEAGVVRSLGTVVEIFEGKGGDDILYRVEIDRAPNHRLDLESVGLEARHQVIGVLVGPGQLKRLP